MVTSRPGSRSIDRYKQSSLLRSSGHPVLVGANLIWSPIACPEEDLFEVLPGCFPGTLPTLANSLLKANLIKHQLVIWYSWVDSNHRPPDPQLAASRSHCITRNNELLRILSLFFCAFAPMLPFVGNEA